MIKETATQLLCAPAPIENLNEGRSIAAKRPLSARVFACASCNKLMRAVDHREFDR
jgi:hypothetical protein